MTLTNQQRRDILAALGAEGVTLTEDEQNRLWQWIDHLSGDYRNRSSATVDNSTLREELEDVKTHVLALRAALEDVSVLAGT